VVDAVAGPFESADVGVVARAGNVLGVERLLLAAASFALIAKRMRIRLRPVSPSPHMFDTND
jgi:hypothetical protein